jgi:hypothetical protein
MLQHSVCPNSYQASKTSHRGPAIHHLERNTTKIAFFRPSTAITTGVAACFINGLRHEIRYLADQSNINRIFAPNNEFKRPINRKTMEFPQAAKIGEYGHLRAYVRHRYPQRLTGNSSSVTGARGSAWAQRRSRSPDDPR